MVNKAIIVGNLGADPEVKYSASGTAVVNLRVATTEYRKDAEGNRTEETEWHRIIAFGVTAENCSKYLTKGSKVYVDGKMKTRKWVDQNNVERYTTEIIANEVKFLSTKNGNGHE